MNIDDMEGLDEETRKEIEGLQKVTREKDGGEAFTEAQLKIFSTSYSNEDYSLGYEALSKIKETDNKISYYLAQINLALIEKDIVNSVYKASERLIKLYENKEFEPISKVVLKGGFLSVEDVMFKFGSELINKEEYKEALKLFNSLGASYSYENYCLIKICMLFLEENTKKIAKYFLDSLRHVLIIQDNLIVDCSHENKYERKLAHYTSTVVANVLLTNPENNKNLFRLNTIYNVNDPSEGSLLTSYLKEKKDNFEKNVDLDVDYHAFLSCFTFNHDSLNQFRLYGKENNKEASGVSLVFNKSFFLDRNIYSKYRKLLNDPINIINIEKTKDVNFNLLTDKTDDNNIDKQNVFRCMYLNAKNDYIHLAQRNKITFYNEFEDKNEAQKHWEEYTKYVDSKKEVVITSLDKLKTNFNSLNEQYRILNINYSRIIDELNSIADEILLPLKYLVKHSAFQEEQECRIVYITSLKNENIRMEFGKFLYVEYEPEVKAHLDKIYIAPAATQYQPYLAKLLCDTNVKIELSNNPFRLSTSY
ncbi:type 1 periplasmic-binding domain-containing protein [Psychrobacter proteolyticus]|uniref:hypothetical protein n=1 Tax=Psychrobacter proteolyticus TaxID=147825 RepID=UPI000E0C3E36|nr:hypothetical protein [Psychrobacter proteolyticus]